MPSMAGVGSGPRRWFPMPGRSTSIDLLEAGHEWRALVHEVSCTEASRLAPAQSCTFA